MHSIGRETEAIEYTVNHSGMTRADVTAEVDRYLVWPGQATAHKIGELKTKVCVRRQRPSLGNALTSGAFTMP
jgi:uncharacterized protein (DUF885 family)